MLRCGLLGEKLQHSYSPEIHARLGNDDYCLFERTPEQLDAFLRGEEWDGLNVTIPYKRSVVPYCDALSPQAKALGSVNTLVRRADGSVYGDNTDHFGFSELIRSSGVSVAGRKAIVLGSGGASVTVCAVLCALRASCVTVISREGEDNYDNLSRHADAEIIVNATPVGMYPHNGEAPVDLRAFPKCKAVFDLIYNPMRTALLLQAEALGIPCFGGLRMLAAQACRSHECFTGETVPAQRIDALTQGLFAKMQNIVLVGMPGCGKSSVAYRLGALTGRTVCDSDALIAQRMGMSVPEIFSSRGEAYFREAETQALRALGKCSGVILSTGGGCVTREENYALLHQNGVIIWLQRDLHRLCAEGRPLSQQRSAQTLYREREALYRRFADLTVGNNASVSETAEEIVRLLKL